MNHHEHDFQHLREAKLKFMPGDFRVLLPGGFVKCAVSGESIGLDDLKYWNVDLQEAYASAEIAFKRYITLGDEGGGE